LKATGLSNRKQAQIIWHERFVERPGYLLLDSQVSERSFGGIIFPGYAIVFEESKQTFTVLYETSLVFKSEFRRVQSVLFKSMIKLYIDCQ